MTDIEQHLKASLNHRYAMVRELGRGGTATVYLVRDLKHDREVALKALPPELATRDRDHELFLREIRIAAGLTHPNILPLHDSGNADGILYYVMPYVVGSSLRVKLNREKQLSIEEACAIVRAVAIALDYAHRRNIVHRDIKPENILFQEGQPLVADFGLARAISAVDAEHVTARGIAVGTPAYMSPEQVSAERDLDGRSDLYSLACVLHEMLAGEPPFVGPNARAVMARHAIASIPSLRAIRADVPVSVERAVEKALAKDPENRFATIAEFADALESGLAEPPPSVGNVETQRMIAVLPFVNSSSDAANEYLSDGITDELINALVKVEGLHVASRTSVFAQKGAQKDVRVIGRTLNASVVLEGSVRKAGNKLRITAQLTNIDDGHLLWSERYDRTLEDVFAIEDDIARTIVGTLRSTLLLHDLADPTPRRYTENVKAYNLYLKGRYHWNQRTQKAARKAIAFFEQAIAEDPGYALAFTGLSDSYALQVDYRGAPVAEGMRRAKVEAGKALELDDTLAEAHTSIAWVTFIYDWDWTTAGRHFRRAIELNPRYATARQWYAWLLIAKQRFEEALSEGRAAAKLDPTSMSIRRTLGWLYVYARQYDVAIEHLRRALVMDPASSETHRVLGMAYMHTGKYDAAKASLREAMESARDPMAMAVFGHLAALHGNMSQARDVVADLHAQAERHYVSPVAFITVYAGLGDTASAFEWLDRAHQERRGWMAYLNVEPLLDRLRADPRFTRLVSEMRLD